MMTVVMTYAFDRVEERWHFRFLNGLTVYFAIIE